MNKTLKKILLTVPIVICALIFGFIAYHHIKINSEKNKYSEMLGNNLKFVTVNSKKIACFEKGSGDKTIVLLSGFGTPSPIANFMPLTEKLSKNYRVVVLEYFGYGLSDSTNDIRSNENFVQEIRSALRELKIDPPYILMPHSFSGIYSLYYAEKYPEEVEAIIGLDDSKPNQMKNNNSMNKHGFDKIKSFLGSYRLIDCFNKNYMEDMFFKGIDKSLYSEDLLTLMHKDFVWHYNSTPNVNEENMMYKNANELFDVKYPETLPVMSILCSKNAEKESLGWVKLHEDVISNSNIQKMEILEGRHYIHYNQVESISKLTDEFIENVIKNSPSAKQGMNSVTVNDKQMRAHVKGTGKQTVVLLSGWSTENPINDFMPLVDELSSEFKVVTLEYFGYGESDITEGERSNEVMVEEIRTALNKLNIRPPYVLMPHSMSGLYSLYYANKYPNEVKAIIGIDASLPQKQLERWTDKTFEDKKLNKNSDGFNVSIINQWNKFYDNSKELKNVKYPEKLPVIAFLASEQIDAVNKMMESNEMKTSWFDINKNVITNSDLQSIVVLDGEHYLHHDQLENISEMSKKFIKEKI